MKAIWELIKSVFMNFVRLFIPEKHTEIILRIENEKEHRKTITEWLSRYVSNGRKKMKYDDLELVFKAIGIQLPIKIIHSHNNQFIFMSNGKKYKATLYSFWADTAILIDDGMVSRKYMISYRQDDNEAWHMGVALDKTTISSGDKLLVGNYEHIGYWTYELSFNNKLKTSLIITEPETPNKSNGTVLYRNVQQVENYLAKLNPYANVDDIYDDLKIIMQLSEEEIKTQGMFIICIGSLDSKTNKIKNFACLNMQYGKCVEYVWMEDVLELPSRIYRITRDGNWSYEEDGKVEFEYKDGLYKSVTFGKREDVEKTDYSDRLRIVEEQINAKRIQKGMA